MPGSREARASSPATDGDGDHLAAIRRFFLQPQEWYSFEELAALWRVHPYDVRDIYHDQLLRRDGSSALRIAWADALGTSIAFNMLRPFDIERALGSDFVRVRPETWRTVPILVHIPRFIAEAIALDASIPPRLPLDVRIEQLIVELFTSGECSIDDGSHDARPWRPA
ncbi:MAG: hypothetical protein M3P06_14200 [Acidobacteriota bacterium]|nr:hypothetical protein [Acidobacteriota bacterium]